MRPPGAVRTTALSCLAFTVAALVGRQSVLPGTELAIVWPAAGIAGVWLAAHARSRWLVVDSALLFVASTVTNFVTGAHATLAVAIGLGAVVQALVLVGLLRRWAPGLCGFADQPPEGVRGVRDGGVLLAAATVAGVASALLGPAATLAVDQRDWAVVATWVVRNATGVLGVFPLALAAPAVLRRLRARGLGPSLHAVAWGRRVEVVALFVVTGIGVWFVFDVNRDLPLPFLLVVACVWAGARFDPAVAGLHSVVLAALVVVLAVLDHGPFVTIVNGYEQALVAQTYVLVAVLVTMFLSLSRQENAGLTAALRDSERAAHDQARLMQTIVDSMADGVTVIDDEGHLVLRNPAAQSLVGRAHLDADGAIDSTGYDFVGADGQPVRVEDTPFAVARRDGVAVRADFVLRDPTSSEDRILDVTATPLPQAGPPMVVVVYHDVTVERHERDELASFAGVVAHDLLNPLTIVQGWTASMADEAEAGVSIDPGVQLRNLDRIQRASRRMQNLIDDLLAYTTARDLVINPVPVDTTALAREIALSRSDAAEATADLPPVIEVGELPPVCAEPVLLRQVLDNLVGNAVKYVAPGVQPVVEVSGRVVGPAPGMVELTVADNGIGIPAGQHASVFETFHRAHREGYRGTGLGLSIVKRVVERHGGTVAAADRPGGGTTITLVLPGAPEPSDPPEPSEMSGPQRPTYQDV